MGLTIYAKNNILLWIKDNTTHLSLHRLNPGENGADEISPMGNNYARISVSSTSWAIPSEGSLYLSEDKIFQGPIGGKATYLGLWETNNFLGSGRLLEDTTFNSFGKLMIRASTRVSL